MWESLAWDEDGRRHSEKRSSSNEIQMFLVFQTHPGRFQLAWNQSNNGKQNRGGAWGCFPSARCPSLRAGSGAAISILSSLLSSFSSGNRMWDLSHSLMRTARSAHFLLIRSSWITTLLRKFGDLFVFSKPRLDQKFFLCCGIPDQGGNQGTFVSKTWIVGIPHLGEKEGGICLQILDCWDS